MNFYHVVSLLSNVPGDSNNLSGVLSGLLDTLESIWNLGQSFVFSVFGLFDLLFPFVPDSVSNTVSAGLMVALIAGIIRFVRGY